ncbi:MAG: DUF4296 domain-containing protein [Bacteroidetes bacterium]|nr:DUF4296 domain-containing protein [Bacteroidota bacterium]MBS1539521.1 DUF4296 domain-containing protein [Bacteroidota bacterium]
MRLCIFLFIVIQLFSCQKKVETSTILTKEQLSALLIDVYLAEARAQTFPRPQDSLMKIFLPREKKILEAHGVSDSLLRQTYNYYYAHPKEFEAVYDVVIDSLTLREQRSLNSKYNSGPVPQKMRVD